MREAGNFSAPLNFVKVKEALSRSNQSFSVFGGEPLLASIEQLKEIWEYGYQKFRSNGIQTNGTLVTPAHVDMFRAYRVHVGVSIDGPEGANSPRCSDEITRKIIDNIQLMTSEGVEVSLITTIHRKSVEHLPGLLRFFKDMELLGVKQVNLHNLEVDNIETAESLDLTDEENFDIFKAIYDDTRQSKIKYLPFEDIKQLLTKRNASATCIWSGCDPLTTPAVHGINPEGALVNCGRTTKEGIDWLKANTPSRERYEALAKTEWKDGGCKDCLYFFACKGQCPGTAIDGDWRNRTKDCQFWYKLMDHIRADIQVSGESLLDFDQMNREFIGSLTGQITEHGDVPHGDSHGDHTDQSRQAAGPGCRVRPA